MMETEDAEEDNSNKIINDEDDEESMDSYGSRDSYDSFDDSMSMMMSLEKWKAMITKSPNLRLGEVITSQIIIAIGRY